MPYNPSHFAPMDLSRTIQGAQQIHYNHLRNEALADQQIERKDMLKNRAKANEIRAMYDNMPDQIAALEGEGMFEQADELRDNYIRTRKSEIELITNLRNGIDESNYKAFRQDMIQSGAVSPSMLPTEYSDSWFRDQAEEKRSSLQKFTIESWENGALMARDIVTESGQLREDLSGEWYDVEARNKAKGKGKGSGSGAGFSVKSADVNAIGKQIERLYGGFFDPVTNQPKGLNPEEAREVQALQEEAERIYQENEGGVTHGVAVARAARRMGIVLTNIRDNAATNPLNLNLQPPAPGQ